MNLREKIIYGCWAVEEEEEIDKTWIESLKDILQIKP